MNEQTKILLEKISFPKESQIHVLRHFAVIPTEWEFIISKTQHKNAREYAGSKFNSTFIKSPIDIISRLKNDSESIQITNLNYKQLVINAKFSEAHFPQGIGVCFIQQKKLSIEACISWELQMALHRNKNCWEVTTCYPVLMKI